VFPRGDDDPPEPAVLIRADSASTEPPALLPGTIPGTHRRVYPAGAPPEPAV
jgi:hypothetical protein